jgi:hypothetical protein
MHNDLRRCRICAWYFRMSLDFAVVPDCLFVIDAAMAKGIGPFVDRMVKHSVQHGPSRPTPFQLPATRTLMHSSTESDLIPQQVSVKASRRAELVKLVEHQLHAAASLLVRTEGDTAGGKFDVAAWNVENQLPALNFLASGTLQAIPNGAQLNGAHGLPEAQDQTIVHVVGVVKGVPIGQHAPEDGAHLQKLMPVLARTGESVQLQSQDQADMVHGDLGDKALEVESQSGGFGAATLIVVENENPIPRACY